MDLLEMTISQVHLSSKCQAARQNLEPEYESSDP